MLQHSNHLEAEYGAGPHTISVPRLRPADGSELSIRPPYEVSSSGAAMCSCIGVCGATHASATHDLPQVAQMGHTDTHTDMQGGEGMQAGCLAGQVLCRLDVVCG
jgi:hypothetical protein